MQAQLLDLFATTATFDNFIPLKNEQIIKLLQDSSSQFTHLTGSANSGKTHLLNAWVNLAHGRGRTAIYLDIQLLDRPIRNLASMFSFIAIDNIELSNDEQQVELFDLFNSIKLNNRDNCLLTSSTNNLSSILTLREDLKTRLLSGVNLNLKALDDHDLEQALNLFTDQEGIKLDSIEQNYLINHYTRNIGVLIQTIRKLAEAAVMHKRHITIPLIKQILKQ